MSKVLVFLVGALAFFSLACGSQAQVETKKNETSVQVVKGAAGVDAPKAEIAPRLQELLASKTDGAIIFTAGSGKYDIVYYPSTKALSVRVYNPVDREEAVKSVKFFFVGYGQTDMTALNLDVCENHPENIEQSKSRWECSPM